VQHQGAQVQVGVRREHNTQLSLHTTPGGRLAHAAPQRPLALYAELDHVPRLPVGRPALIVQAGVQLGLILRLRGRERRQDGAQAPGLRLHTRKALASAALAEPAARP